MTQKVLGKPKELLGKRREILERIREQMPSEAAALEALDMALGVMGEHAAARSESGEYAEVRRGLDALVMHLTKAGRPMERRRLVREVIAGGWANGDPLAYMRLWDVIRHQIKGAVSPQIVQRKDGTVTLAPKKPGS
jgi:hypothetical protein